MLTEFCDKDSNGNLITPNLGGGGTLLHRKDGKFLIQRYSHDIASRTMPRSKMLKHRDVFKTERVKWNHYESFVQACMGNGKTRSPFSVAGPLTQTLLMGVICQYLNTDLDFDLKTKRFTNNTAANAVLDGPAPRKGWEDYYKTV